MWFLFSVNTHLAMVIIKDLLLVCFSEKKKTMELLGMEGHPYSKFKMNEIFCEFSQLATLS